MKTKLYSAFLLTFLIGIIILNTFNDFKVHATDIIITVNTDKTSYFEREKVAVNCTLTGNYASNTDLLGIEVKNSIGEPLLFRTIKISEPKTLWAQIFDIYLSDQWGFPASSVRANATAYFNFSYKVNFPSPPIDICATVTVYDAKNITLGAVKYIFHDLTEGVYPFVASVLIPPWATPGIATMYANLFTNLPELGGVPYCTEFVKTFPIASLSTGIIPNSMDTTDSSTNIENANGTYITEFRLSSEAMTGKYRAYATTKAGVDLLSDYADFTVESASYPPIAYFTYTPSKPYPGCTVYFDASGSTADPPATIVSYTWNFDDGTPPITEDDPEISHIFTSAGTYNVTLIVTDSQGLWSFFGLGLKVWAPYGPTADFTYTPREPFKGGFITFNASISKLGWNGTYYPPITSYIWDFGDGTPLVYESDPITNHTYSIEGNYSVTLKIIDELSQWDTETKLLNVTAIEIIHDVAVIQLNFLSAAYCGWQVNISVTVNNTGTIAETFYLEIYLNTSLLYNQSIVQLSPFETRVIIYTLNTTLYQTGNYTIKAVASEVLDEINIGNNILENPFRLKIMADIDGDGSVGPIDLGLLGVAWGSFEGETNFNIQCDLDQDGAISPLDLGIMGRYWGQFE
jgi:parallel beta-helix repeat protein